ncbi:anthranilate synthase beta subunit 2, chloroplastic-like [Impatiens glandulifera]|uniref:anthranilate synthase beta subunit 2, chloroplastic-like n=1 Tax=Impatiens glandulifera TaxID=253017 RepID=UPI001FB1143B|nr:anthranilate synthase beta subunit 2, chloroplastic-like [Impatiens glandulifera]
MAMAACGVSRLDVTVSTTLVQLKTLSRPLQTLNQFNPLSSSSLSSCKIPTTSQEWQQGLRLRAERKTSLCGPPMAVNGIAPISTSIPDIKTSNPIVVIDNYDSFTYNLCQYMGELGCEFVVYRNDELTVEELKKKCPRGVVISPGPGTPQDSGISLKTVLELGPTIPIFGVCMGLQCIGEAFGGKIVRSPSGVMHGKSSPVYYNEGEEEGLFTGLSNPFSAGRYHSLVIEKESFPHDELEITAWTEDGLVMAARHKKYKHIMGVQFHPESILSTEGKEIVNNFIKFIKKNEQAKTE